MVVEKRICYGEDNIHTWSTEDFVLLVLTERLSEKIFKELDQTLLEEKRVRCTSIRYQLVRGEKPQVSPSKFPDAV
jgi:hypothetical protein